jgi:Domain of unknown function (DUF5664)
MSIFKDQESAFEDEGEGLYNYNIYSSPIAEDTTQEVEEGSKCEAIPLDPHTPGTKLDDTKPDLDLVLSDFSRALIEVGKIGTFGAKKYTEHGWLSVPRGYRRYQSAMLRHHFIKEEDGEYDTESGLLHDAHRAWNALAALELRLRGLHEV